MSVAGEKVPTPPLLVLLQGNIAVADTYGGLVWFPSSSYRFERPKPPWPRNFSILYFPPCKRVFGFSCMVNNIMKFVITYVIQKDI